MPFSGQDKGTLTVPWLLQEPHDHPYYLPVRYQIGSVHPFPHAGCAFPSSPPMQILPDCPQSTLNFPSSNQSYLTVPAPGEPHHLYST